METLIFVAGLFISLLFFVGFFLYKRELSTHRASEKRKKANNEYRTNEEYISFP